MPSRPPQLTLTVVLVALFAVVVWGASPIATKFAVTEIPPVAVAALRTWLGVLIAIPLALLSRISLPATGQQWRLLLLSGICGYILFPAMFSLGMRSTSGIHGSMILALLPVLTGAIARVWDRGWPHGLWWLGCGVAIVGEAILILGPINAGDQVSSLYGDAIVLASTVFAATGYVAGARLKIAGYTSQGTTYWGVAIASILLLPLVPWMLDAVAWESVSAAAWGGIVYLAVGITIIGYICWYWALGRGGVERVAVFQFLQPVSGVILASVLLHEALELTLLAATVLILAGVWMATRLAKA